MLKKIRVALAVVFWVGITLLLLAFTGVLHHYLGWMAKIQFLPAVMALNVGVIVGLVLLTLLFGRVYCSSADAPQFEPFHVRMVGVASSVGTRIWSPLSGVALHARSLTATSKNVGLTTIVGVSFSPSLPAISAAVASGRP